MSKFIKGNNKKDPLGEFSMRAGFLFGRRVDLRGQRFFALLAFKGPTFLKEAM